MTAPFKWKLECTVCHKVFKVDDPQKPVPTHKMPNNPYVECVGSKTLGIPRGAD